MMIDRVNKAVKSFLNTDDIGNYTPSDFNLFAYQSVNEIQEELLYKLNRLLNRQNRGLISSGLGNLPERAQEKINFYSSSATLTKTGTQYNLPEDCRYIDYIETNGNRIAVALSASEYNLIVRNKHTKPREKNPLALMEGKQLTINPTPTETVKCYYLRNPKLPNWTYNSIGGEEVFNPSDPKFQDVDIHPSEEHALVIKILFKFGVNLKETDVQQISKIIENEEFKEENTL